jgi:hypothetical protein
VAAWNLDHTFEWLMLPGLDTSQRPGGRKRMSKLARRKMEIE